MSEISINLYNARNLDRGGWYKLHEISQEALAATFEDRSSEEITALVGDKGLFYESHADPNSQVGVRYNANQAFTHPRVAVASEDGKAIGFAYAAHNVSGANGAVRFAKRMLPSKNYLWLREVAVRPGKQHEGIATALGMALLKDTMPFRPVATYIWPEEIPFLQPLLQSVGFVETGEQNVHLFGDYSQPVKQVRLQAPSVGSVLRAMVQKQE